MIGSQTNLRLQQEHPNRLTESCGEVSSYQLKTGPRSYAEFRSWSCLLFAKPASEPPASNPIADDATELGVWCNRCENSSSQPALKCKAAEQAANPACINTASRSRNQWAELERPLWERSLSAEYLETADWFRCLEMSPIRSSSVLKHPLAIIVMFFTWLVL